jgi:hypothetical protein
MGGDRSVGHLLLNDVFYYTTLGGKKWAFNIDNFRNPLLSGSWYKAGLPEFQQGFTLKTANPHQGRPLQYFWLWYGRCRFSPGYLWPQCHFGKRCIVCCTVPGAVVRFDRL